MTTKATKQLSDLINNTDSNTKKPTHNLVVSVTTESGVRSLGKIGLFTQNNPLHQVIAELTHDDLTELGSILHFGIEEFSETNSETKPKLAFKR